MVFIPLSDDNPLRAIRYQYVTVALIAANVAFYLLELMEPGSKHFMSFALVPTELFQANIFGSNAHGPYDTLAVPEGATLLTCDAHFEGPPGVTLIEKIKA